MIGLRRYNLIQINEPYHQSKNTFGSFSALLQGDASAVGDTGVGTNNAPVKFNAPENAQVLVKTGGIRIHDRERYEVGAGRDYEIQENSDVPVILHIIIKLHP